MSKNGKGRGWGPDMGEQSAGTVLPHCYALLAVTPPPYFRAKLLYKVILSPLHAPPPAGRSSRFAVLQFLHVHTCCKCRRVVFVYQVCKK